jgi:hypothetical protein
MCYVIYLESVDDKTNIFYNITTVEVTMKHLFAGLLVTALSLTAQAGTPNWNLTNVQNKDKVTVGYIYHTYAAGTQIGVRTEKVAAGLRLVCSTKGSNEPVIAIFWSGWTGSGITQSIWSATDGKVVSGDVWTQDVSLLYRPLSQSTKLIDAMKKSRTVQFTWIGYDAVKYDVVFDTTGFNAKLAEFNASCKTQI